MSTFNISNFRSEVLGKGLARNDRFEVVFNIPKGITLMPKYTAIYNPSNASVWQQLNNVLGNVAAIGGLIKYGGIGTVIATNAISAITAAAKDKPVNLTDDRRVCLLCEATNFPLLNINVKSQRIFGPAYQRPITSEYGGEGIALTFHVDREMTVKRLFDAWMETIVAGGGASNFEWRNTYTVAYQDEYACNITINQLDEFDNVTYSIQLQDAFPRVMNMMDLNNSSQNQTHRLTVLFAYRKWESVSPAVSSAARTPQLGLLAQIGGLIRNIF